MKNEQGRPLDGFSMKPFLDPENGNGMDLSLQLPALYKWAQYYDPAYQNYSLDLKIGDMFAMRMEKKNSITLQKMTTNGITWLRIQNLRKN